MAKRKIFVTAALPYVNNQPHLGNIIGSTLSADVYYRFLRQRGHDAVYICGTDEYGTATEMEATKQNITPMEIINKNRPLHVDVYKFLNLDFSYFGQTTNNYHKEITQKIFKKIYENGWFEEKTIKMHFCLKCQQFLPDRYIAGTCSLCNFEEAKGDQCDNCNKIGEILNPKCTICKGNEIEYKDTKHLFLKLDELQDLIRKNIDISGWSENAKSIYESWINKDLIPRCMTRDLKHRWGVSVPIEGYENKVLYVWFDAPIGYLSFLSQARPDWQDFYNDSTIVQFMGKDNVFFHSIVFPGILLAYNHKRGDDLSISEGEKLKIVDIINATEYLTFNGDKFSKSRGIGIFGMDLIKKDLGMSCFWRFFLLHRRPETKDCDFCVDSFILEVKTKLINIFGNFVNRVLKFLSKKGFVEPLRDDNFINDVNFLYKEYLSDMNDASLRKGLEKCLEICQYGNTFVTKAIESGENKYSMISLCYSLVILSGIVFEPFIPVTTEKLFKMCGYDGDKNWDEFKIIEGKIVGTVEPLFPNDFTDAQKANLSKYNN